MNVKHLEGWINPSQPACNFITSQESESIKFKGEVHSKTTVNPELISEAYTSILF